MILIDLIFFHYAFILISWFPIHVSSLDLSTLFSSLSFASSIEKKKKKNTNKNNNKQQ